MPTKTSAASAATEAAFAAIARRYGGVPKADGGRKFGANALKVNDKIFAFVKGDSLVLKLPAARVDALVKAGAGVRFDRGQGTPMKEWIAVAPAQHVKWPALAKEAHAFVKDAGK